MTNLGHGEGHHSLHCAQSAVTVPWQWSTSAGVTIPLPHDRESSQAGRGGACKGRGAGRDEGRRRASAGFTEALIRAGEQGGLRMEAGMGGKRFTLKKVGQISTCFSKTTPWIVWEVELGENRSLKGCKDVSLAKV